MKKELSIILPVFNEKESLSTMVRLLKSSLDFENEILIIHDHKDDNSIIEAKKLEKELSNIKVIHNDIHPGVRFAIDKGVNEAKHEIILITVVDDIFPIMAINEMIKLITDNNFEFVSGTRYSKGGKRLGGSLLGLILSKVANKLFKLLTNFPLSDCTTGIKMMKKEVWKKIKLEAKPIGWAFAFELSIKVFLENYKITEVPFKSVDRLFGGSSTFKPWSWFNEYLKWFFWGYKKIRKIKN